MPEKTYALKALGLEIDNRRLKAAVLIKQRKTIQIDQLYTFSLEEVHKHTEHHVNPLILVEEGKSFLELASNSLVASAINGQEILIRPLEVKLKKEKDIDAVLLFQAEPLIPYPIENAVVDKIILDGGSEGTRMTLLVVRKDHLQHHLLQWQQLEIEPEIVAAVPSALAAISKYILPNSDSNVVLHLEDKQTCCAFVKNHKLIAAQSSSFDLQGLRQMLAKEIPTKDLAAIEQTFAEIDWTNFPSSKFPLTASALNNFHMEVNRIVSSLVRQVKILETPPILITGDIANYPTLQTAVLGGLQESIVMPELQGMEDIPWRAIQSHAIPIGSSLMAFPEFADQVNFRQADFAYPHPWKRLLRPLAIYAAAMCFLAASFYFFGQAYTKKRENDVRKEYANLLISINKPYQTLETELVNRGKKNPTIPTQIPPIESLSPDDIQTRMDFINKELQQMPDLFPLQPAIPRVSDVLAWLTTHPNVIQKNASPETHPLIEIDSFNYFFTKRPDLNKKQEKYQVKVEIEFNAANATAAREFHEALLAPNAYIDPKAEVKWSSLKGKYKVSFFLKDKTTYP